MCALKGLATLVLQTEAINCPEKYISIGRNKFHLFSTMLIYKIIMYVVYLLRNFSNATFFFIIKRAK